MPYLYNAWYVAAWAHEIDQTFFTRTLLDLPVLFYRKPDGQVVAMEDACPHRFAPLSMGVLVDGKVRCGYHGLEFDEHGACVGSCINVVAPKAARVRTFPVFEQDNIIWIWMGPGPAGPTEAIVRFPFHTDSALRPVFGVSAAKADYRLFSDNLMDLTHTAMLHPLFGGLNYQPKFRSWEEGDDVVSEYTSEAPSSMLVGDTPVTGVDTIRWRAPGIHSLLTRVTPKDAAFQAAEMPAAHIVTPETATSTHYFWASALPKDSPVSSEAFLASLTQVFDHEDKPMIEAVQRRMGQRELFDLKPILLSIDASSVRVRRKLNAMIERERAEATAGSPLQPVS
ncbi:ring-hydroxylating dioxygenase, large terminal subunit [Caulobacter sp. AP07]|uniref:aromatic ring-hydroxylating dioxygenase subunit alpha n=1 Tax=Caulobacter sp. AP07 TaxID=1144304 RepID=UPI0002720C55|nr:aromatic ring-hydroxylating dioxygenase subunit alpha [Caulobacter sp. AP07]EJL27330.1 ring-hydroxylating dioxygenase, large terminal subunit [Caulobacter sp. AP07]